jgi:hypothetical protein
MRARVPLACLSPLVFIFGRTARIVCHSQSCPSERTLMNASAYSAMGVPTIRAIKCLSTLVILLSLTSLLASGANAQSEVTMSVTGPGGSAHSVTRYAGGTVTLEFTQTTPDGSSENRTVSAKLSDLDLENVYFSMDSRYDRFGARLQCKADRGDCVSEQGAGNTSDLSAWCDSEVECRQFINFLKQAQAPGPTPQSIQPPVQAPPVQNRPVAAAPQAAAAAPPSPAMLSALRDLIATISWLNGVQAVNNSALDKLLKQIEAGKQPTPPPPTKPVYAAFAQAGGFDANGSWGAATASDLNTAIANANGNCSQGANTSCDDEGYCLLRSGVWAAWASDLMVAGNSAFACNLKAQDEAISQAQTWCGDGCKVLWSGVGP